jgi:hypothetical protein
MSEGLSVRPPGTVPEGDWEGTVVARHADGSHFIARVAMTPERSQGGMPIGFLAMSSDVVEDVILDVELHRTPAHGYSELKSVPDAMVIVSARDETQFADAEAAILHSESRGGLGRSAVEMLIADRYLDRHPGVRMGFFAESRADPGEPGREGFAQSQNAGATCYVHKQVEFQQCCNVVRTMRLLWRLTGEGTSAHARPSHSDSILGSPGSACARHPGCRAGGFDRCRVR